MKKRNGEIDLLKFVFSMIIMVFHSKNFVVTDDERLFMGGAIGVSFFFIVSGYLMVQSYMKNTVDVSESIGLVTVQFIWKKIKGFMPNLYIVWIIAFIVEAFIVDGATFFEGLKKLCYGIFELLFLSMAGFIGGDAFRANSVTWYLSAMLLVMAIFYPILLKKKESFLILIAPLIAIFIYGYVFSNFKAGFSAPSTSVGWIRKGLLRGFAEIALGCTCFLPAQKLKSLRTTKVFDTLMTVIGTMCYGIVIYQSYNTLSVIQCLISGLLLAVGVTISFSGKTLWGRFLNNKFVLWLGEISFDIYISHGFWCHAMKKLLPENSFKERFMVYMLLIIVTVMVVRFIAIVIRKICPILSKEFRKVMFLS